MASALRRRAAAAVVATIRGTVSGRPLSSVAAPRLPAAAATKATALRLSSAAATIRSGPTPVAARLRCNHTSAIPEAVEARIQRVEMDFDSKLMALRVELQGGSADMLQGIRDALHKVEVVHLQAYDSLLQGQARQDNTLANLADSILAEGRRSVHRAATSSAESARSLAQVGQVSWRVVVTVVGAAGAAAFSMAQLLRADTTTKQTQVADAVVRARTAQLHDEFATKLEQTVHKSIELALAKEARRRALADDEALHAFAARVDDLIEGLDDRVKTAVEAALAIDKKQQPQGGGGPKPA